MTPSFVPNGDAVRKSLDGARAGAAALGQSISAASRTSQTIGIEWMDYLKQVSSDVTATTEKVVKAKSPAKAIELQGAFMRASARAADGARRDLPRALRDAGAGHGQALQRSGAAERGLRRARGRRGRSRTVARRRLAKLRPAL